MAIFYSRFSVISRGRGQSAVAAAAYRCAARFVDERTGAVHSYERKSGVIDFVLLAPPAASWATDVGQVWNRAEKAEVRRNARVGRELIVALPHELGTADQVLLANRIGQDLVDTYGIVALVAVHAPDRCSDDRNTHTHILLSTRVATHVGFGKKVRCLDDKLTGPQEAEAIRTRVAERINQSLAQHGHTEQVDPRRLKVRAQEAAEKGNLEAVAELTRTPQKHVGRAGMAAKRRGQYSPVVSANEQVIRDNQRICALGRQRAAQMRNDIHRAVLDESMRCSRTSVNSRTTLSAPERSATALYLASLRDTEQFVRELVKSSQHTEILRDVGTRLEQRTAELLASLDSTSRKTLLALQAQDAFEQQRQLRRKSVFPEGRSTPQQIADSSPQNTLSPAVMSRREWAEIRRQQRKVAAENESTNEVCRPPSATRVRPRL